VVKKQALARAGDHQVSSALCLHPAPARSIKAQHYEDLMGPLSMRVTNPFNLCISTSKESDLNAS
jgi:hypothetical protein